MLRTASLVERGLVSSCLQLDSDPSNAALPFRQPLIDDSRVLMWGHSGTRLWGLFHHTAALPLHSALGEGVAVTLATAQRKWGQEGQLAEAGEGA